MLGLWDLSSCLSLFLRFLSVAPQQKARLRWLVRTVREGFRYIKVHLRESLVTTGAGSLVSSAAVSSWLLATTICRYLGYLSSKDGRSIQQQIDRAQKMASGLCVLSAVGKSETPSTFGLILAIQKYAPPHDDEANVLFTLDRSLSKQNRIAELVRAQL